MNEDKIDFRETPNFLEKLNYYIVTKTIKKTEKNPKLVIMLS